MAFVILGAAALGFTALYRLVIAVRAGDSAYFEVTPVHLAFALACGFAIAGGVMAIAGTGARSLGAMFALAGGLMLFSLLAIFSIGLFLLPGALIASVIAVRSLRRSGSTSARAAAIAGVLTGFAVIPYTLLLLQSAVAGCTPTGMYASSGGGLFGGARGVGGGYAAPGGGAGGWIDEGATIARFTCQNGKLIELHREPRPSDFDPQRLTPPPR